jgi:hypothetical protein
MIGAVDLTDLDMWVRGVPYHEFARLRRQAPVAWFPDQGSGPVDGSAAAVDVGTLPFDPRIEIRRQDGS